MMYVPIKPFLTQKTVIPPMYDYIIDTEYCADVLLLANCKRSIFVLQLKLHWHQVQPQMHVINTR